ncbi:hypothetical protein [Brucella pituitosa]|uniref:Uncharacterized protein n=1 Tax=Brucella pituitosa TaxID=571256 RepID=A0ABS3JUW4_9HYPH|nr:hypothetical protein [Brucella pituitosa]MBO1038464.1 hypothetical protein [Brucella pituitosa]
MVRENFKANKALLCAVFLLPFIMGAISFYLKFASGLNEELQSMVVLGLTVVLLVAALQSINSDARINGYAFPSRGLLFVGVLLLPLAQLLYLLRTRKPVRAIVLLILFWITIFLSTLAGAVVCLLVMMALSQF